MPSGYSRTAVKGKKWTNQEPRAGFKVLIIRITQNA